MRSVFVAILLSAVFLPAPPATAQQTATIWKEVPDIVLKLDGSKSGQGGDKNEIHVFQELRGALTVFYFWRHTSLDSVERLAEIRDLHRKYYKRGVRFVSISTSKEKKHDDIMQDYLDIFRWTFRGSPGGYYYLGALSDPYVVIVGPRGVLLWRGVPDDRLDQRIADLIELTKPPLGDPERLQRYFRKAERLLKQGEAGRAYTIARGLFKLTDEGQPINGKADSLAAQCENAAAKQIKEAIQAERNKDYKEAARIIAEIAVRFEDPDKDKNNQNNRDDADSDNVKRKAEYEIGRMNGNRKLKEAIREARKNAEGEVLLDKGENLEDDGYYIDAKRVYVSIIRKYKDTDAAKEAKKRIRRIKHDKEIQAKVAEQRQIRDAWALLDIADHFASIEFFGEARERYEQIVADYPKTVAAKRAKERLADLPEANKEAKATAKP